MKTLLRCAAAILFVIGASWAMGQFPPPPPVQGTGGTTTTTLPGPPVGGMVTGEAGTVAICRNLTTGLAVPIPLGGGDSWDCEDAGLGVRPGDRILQISIGTAN